MGTTTRSVRGERGRRRLPQRSPAARWTRRVVGVLATVALLGVAWAIYAMVKPGDAAPASAAPAPTVVAKTVDKPAAAKRRHAKRTRRSGPSKAALASLRRAESQLRAQGYVTVARGGYDVKHTLRVLLARPVGDASAGRTAFFFEGGTLLGRDSTSPSASLKVARTSTTTATLAYGVYDGGSSPRRTTAVRFKLSGGAVAPQQAIPDAVDRVAAG